jgi:hypothetical protein
MPTSSEGRLHVHPLNDLREHVIDPDVECWCNPTYDEEYDIVIHNSLDGRELYETGERLPQ